MDTLKISPKDERLTWYRIALLTLLIETYPQGVREGDDPWKYLQEAYRYAGDHVQLRAVVKRTEAILLRKLRRVEDAVNLMEYVIKEMENIADHNGKLVALRELAIAHYEKGEIAKAQHIINKAIHFLDNLGTDNPIRRAELFEEKAIIFGGEGKLRMAKKWAKSSKKIYERIGAPLRVFNVDVRLSPYLS